MSNIAIFTVRRLILRAAIVVDRAGELVPLLALSRSDRRGGVGAPCEIVTAFPPHDPVRWEDLDQAELRAIGEQLAADYRRQVAELDDAPEHVRSFCAAMGISLATFEAETARACGEAVVVRRVSMLAASQPPTALAGAVEAGELAS